jgi:hypothetical protein
MSVPSLLNVAGRHRSSVTLPGYLAGRAPRNKGLRYPLDPPTVEEIVAVMRQAGEAAHGARMRALIMLLWRAGLRINEALTVSEHDLEPRAGSVLGRHGTCTALASDAARAQLRRVASKAGYGDGSRPTSCATLTPSSSPTSGSRST